MRAKTTYKERPAEYEIQNGDAGESVILFRENITEIETEDGSAYETDEYEIVVRSSDDIESRVEANVSAWRERAVQEDFDRTAKAVRAERDALIAKTDYLMESDYPITEEKRHKVEVYRQALRDIPQQSGFPYDVVFPEKSF